MTNAERDTLAQQVNVQLIKLEVHAVNPVLHAFIPMESEVDIKPFLNRWMESERLLVTPQTLANRRLRNLVTTSLDNLRVGVFNTRYASSTEQYSGPYDIILVPGLAFTASGHRLGYGGGYYDTFLAQHPEALKVGVGYTSQLVAQLPIENHDIALDVLLLGDQIFRVSE